MTGVEEIRLVANGMLPTKVYEHMQAVAATVDGDVLEIGTAHGAGTISVAKALAPPHRIVTVDRLTNGSRERFGSVEDNARIIRDNFARFGVADRVEMLIGSSTDAAASLAPDRRFAMMILDADGIIDRDIRLFYDRLEPGAPVMIDDCDRDRVRVFLTGLGAAEVDQKYRLTALLVDVLERHGFLETDRKVNDTWFGRKPPTAPPAAEMPVEDILGVYRELVFAAGRLPAPTLNSLMKFANRRWPNSYKRVKQIYTTGLSRPS